MFRFRNIGSSSPVYAALAFFLLSAHLFLIISERRRLPSGVIPRRRFLRWWLPAVWLPSRAAMARFKRSRSCLSWAMISDRFKVRPPQIARKTNSLASWPASKSGKPAAPSDRFFGNYFILRTDCV